MHHRKSPLEAGRSLGSAHYLRIPVIALVPVAMVGCGEEESAEANASGTDVPGNFDSFLEEVAAGEEAYCRLVSECDRETDLDECLSTWAGDLETNFGDFTQDCLDALAAYTNCVNEGTFTCDGDPDSGSYYLAADADCSDLYAAVFPDCNRED